VIVDRIAEITQENLLLKKRPDLLGEKMTDILREIRSAAWHSSADVLYLFRWV
jgi:hypothetical protein